MLFRSGRGRVRQQFAPNGVTPQSKSHTDRRREETAATRSLLNTARVMEENPTALRLKELETLEKVTEKIDKISVYGGLDGVLKGLINIQQPK